ncbi:GerW family sporulation protein [Chloroflexota bacterium]
MLISHCHRSEDGRATTNYSERRWVTTEEVDSLVKTTLGEIEKVLSTRTVVGEPITIQSATLIPLISVGFGFGAGGGSGKGEAKQKGEGSGGGTGGGAWVKPIAVVIIDKEGVRIEPIRGGLATAIERIGETIPQMIEKCMETCMQKWSERKKEG